MGNDGYRYQRRRAAPPPRNPQRYTQEPLDVECMSVKHRLSLIDRRVAAHPGEPVGDIILELFPELERMREERRGLTCWHSYIGALDEPAFRWDQPSDDVAGPAAKLPRRIVPREHFESVGVSVFFLMEQSRSGQPECRKLDWGAWGWKLTGQDLIEFFGPHHRHAQAIATLEPDRHYVLVAAEGV